MLKNSLPKRHLDSNNVYHLFPVLCERLDELQKYLSENGVQTLIHKPIPPHKQECYKQWKAQTYPITEQVYQQDLIMTISPVMDEKKPVLYLD